MDCQSREKPPPTRFDEMTQIPEMTAIKAMIPYMEPEYGKKAAIAVKIFEIRRIIESFENEVFIKATDGNRRKSIISAIRPYCDEGTVQMAELIDRAIEMRKVLEMLTHLNSANGIDATKGTDK